MSMQHTPISDSVLSPVCLTVAGSDCSGGAGIQADLKTFASLGVYGASAITAITVQNTQGVQGVEPISSETVSAQMQAVLADSNVQAIKTGMLCDRETVLAVAEVLKDFSGKVVVDPVLVSSSEKRLLAEEAVETLRDVLLPCAELITPNIPEAYALLGESESGESELNESEPGESQPESVTYSAEAMVELARRLQQRFDTAVLLKGGHQGTDILTDVLIEANQETLFHHKKVMTRNTHGTGCTLSAAIAARLCAGDALCDAVETAQGFLQDALLAGTDYVVGKGSGPVDHFYHIPKAGHPAQMAEENVS